MNYAIVIAGTNTDVGKTVFAAALVSAIGGYYWKPIQAGLDGETDSDIVARLGALPAGRVLKEVYRLNTPASPHYAAECDQLEIDLARLDIPKTTAPLVIELAGGLLVPITRSLLQIDMLAAWKVPVVLVASTRLGTINHSLLSIEALKRRGIPILGIAFSGDEATDGQRTICDFGGVTFLGRLPQLSPLTPETLKAAFADNFDIGQILGLGSSGP